MANEPISVHVAGPSPYGFRLLGGGGDPLVVAKLRVKSKTYEAGLRENDVILGINGRSCQTISHADAIRIVEESTAHIDLLVIRGTSGQQALDAAFQALGSSLRPPTPTNQKSESQGSTNFTQLTDQSGHAPTIGTTRTTIATSTEHQGGLTITKTTKQVTSEYSDAATHPYGQSQRDREKEEFLQRAKNQSFNLRTEHSLHLLPADAAPTVELEPFKPTTEVIVYRHVPNAPLAALQTPAAPPLFAPFVATLPKPYVPPPSEPVILSTPLFQPTVNRFSPTTFPRENNLLPNAAPSSHVTGPLHHTSTANFNVRPTSATPWVWQPSHVPQVHSKPMEDFQLDAVESTPIRYDETIAKHTPNHVTGGEGQGGSTEVHGGDDEIPLHLVKILTRINESDPLLIHRKNIYADSSFYDDPEHKYPTIEEQIKMARRVALSLTAPVNVTARGQRMFMKRQERSKLWSIDHPGYHHELSSQELYYNPSPWHSSQRRKHPATPISWEKKIEIREVFNKKTDFRTKVRFPKKFEKKSIGTDASRQQRVVSFNLSEELIGNRSNKGSKLFNERRAKSEEPEERQGDAQLRKFGGSQFHLERPSRLVAAGPETENGGQPHTQQSRLRELIEEYNVRRSPFDAGDDYSSVGIHFKDQEWSKGPSGGREKEWGGADRTPSSGSIERDFSTKFSHKKRANFRPVRFKAPQGFGSMQPSVQTTQSDELEDDVQGPVSDF